MIEALVKNLERWLKKHLLQAELHRALTQSEFLVHYQPIIQLASGAVSGFEALVRWQPPKDKLIYPDSFILMAEENRQIIPIDYWVLSEVCQQQVRRQEWSFTPPPCFTSVNLSGIHFRDPHLAEKLEAIMAENQTCARGIIFEITESAAIEDLPQAVKTMTRLRDAGASLYLDDFGNGYSSLKTLIEFPVDGVKIDRSFIKKMAYDPRYFRAVSAIVAVGHDLGKCVVAEGIETQQELEKAKKLGCDLGQGFLFSGPLDENAMQAYLGCQHT
jgi:EAL domain-containing protein (putative c-di-GMP-specific phosphodiesterase class I)